jgi:hypothetical protein
MGFIDAPSPTWPSLRPLPPEPSLRLRSGTATFQTRSVLAVPPGFNGFLRSSLRSEDRRPSTTCRFVAPCSRSWGSLRFGAPVRPLGRLPSVAGRLAKLLPVAKTLRSVPLSRQPDRSSPQPSSRREAFTERRSLSSLVVMRRSAFPQRRHTRPRAQGFVPPESPLLSAQRCHCVQLDAPMGFGSSRSDACRAHGAGWIGATRVTPAVPTSRGCPHRPRAVGRQDSRLVWPGRADAGSDPKVGARRSGSLTARRLLRFRSAHTRPEGRAGIGRIGGGRPEGRPPPAPRRYPEGSRRSAGG